MNAFSTISRSQPPNPTEWVLDSDASSHVTQQRHYLPLVFLSFIYLVVNGSTLSVIGTGYTLLPGPFSLNNILITRNIIKKLLSVHQCTTDNLVSIEFDPLSFSLKDLHTRTVLLRCGRPEPLYTLQL